MVDEIAFAGMQYMIHPRSHMIPIKCGHCQRDISGYVVAEYPQTDPPVAWIMCPICSHGSVKDRDGLTYPGPKFGDNLKGLPADIDDAYNEARNCISVGAYSACTLICRKILMHIAVDKGDTEGKKFVEYIDYLKTSDYVTSAMDDWVDKIREGGNDSTHKIPPASEDKAKNILLFIIQMLRNVYEMQFIADEQTNSEQSS